MKTVQNYFQTLWQVITRPNFFFRQMPLEGGMSGPLAFALVTHWIGSAVSFIWTSLVSRWMSAYVGTFTKIAEDIANTTGDGTPLPWSQMMSLKDRYFQWFWGAGSIIADPFYTLGSVLFTSVFVFLGARLFAAPGLFHKNGDAPAAPATFESALRLVCYGMSPMILAGIPLFGWGLASLLSLIITVIGAKEVYRVGTGRGVLIVLFPKLLFLGLILFGFLVFALVFVKLFTSII